MEIGDIKKPVKRLWMQSMTNNSILEAWENLRTGESDETARRCREVPLRVGLAGRPQRHPRPHLLQFPPRRLQHHRRRPRADPDARHPRPREAEIQAFKPTPYFEVHATFGVAGRRIPRQMDRRSLEKGRNRPALQARAHLGQADRRGDPSPLRRQDRQGLRGKEGATPRSPRSFTTSPRSSARPRFPPRAPSRSPRRFTKSTR